MLKIWQMPFLCSQRKTFFKECVHALPKYNKKFTYRRACLYLLRGSISGFSCTLTFICLNLEVNRIRLITYFIQRNESNTSILIISAICIHPFRPLPYLVSVYYLDYPYRRKEFYLPRISLQAQQAHQEMLQYLFCLAVQRWLSLLAIRYIFHR